jgi:hypothetical protein
VRGRAIEEKGSIGCGADFGPSSAARSTRTKLATFTDVRAHFRDNLTKQDPRPMPSPSGQLYWVVCSIQCDGPTFPLRAATGNLPLDPRQAKVQGAHQVDLTLLKQARRLSSCLPGLDGGRARNRRAILRTLIVAVSQNVDALSSAQKLSSSAA